MAVFHPALTRERWNNFTSVQQILNIAAEFGRARQQLQNENRDNFLHSLDRAFELIDLTVEDRSKWSGGRLWELLCMREMLGEFYTGANTSVEELRGLTRALLCLDKDTAAVEL